jgi:hypothetical protein
VLHCMPGILGDSFCAARKVTFHFMFAEVRFNQNKIHITCSSCKILQAICCIYQILNEEESGLPGDNVRLC